MSSVLMHWKWWDGDEDLVQTTPEGAATLRNLVLGDGSQIRYDNQGKPWLRAEDVLVRLMDDTFGKITLEREAVLGHFWADSAQFLAASGAEDRKQLKEWLSECPDTEKCCKKAGPEVEICEDNRISFQTLYQAQGSRQLGKFLLCRTLTPALNGVWLEMVVEDPSGQSGLLLLTNFTPSKYSRDVGRQGENNGGHDGSLIGSLGALPPGSFIVVKNVYALPRVPEMAARPCETFLLQAACHNPADVVLLTPRKMKELLPDLVWHGPIPQESFWDVVLAGKTEAEIIEALKRKGDEAFVFKRYTDAIRCYDLALDYVGGGDHDGQFTAIWSNKAASFLGLGLSSEALKSADKALLRDPLHVKAIHRKVKAMIGLGFGGCIDALAFIEQKFAAAPFLKEIEDLSRLLYMIPKPGKAPYFDSLSTMLEYYEDFGVHSPGPVEYRPNPITGRGVFAIQDIEPNDIQVFLQRSLARVGAIEEEDSDEGRDLSDAELVGIIANKIALAPELGSQIYSLWAGKKLLALDPEDPTINLVNIYRIQKIVQYNSRYAPPEASVRPSPRKIGLWGITLFLSQLNHRCSEANVVSHQHDNWNIILASKPIKKGDEIFAHWINVSDSLKCRRSALKKLGLVCHCSLCQRDSQDDFQVKRKFTKLWSRFSQYSTHDYEVNSKKVDSALTIMNKIAELRPDAPHLHAIMTHPTVAALCNVLFHKEKYADHYMDQYVDLGKKVFLVAETMNNLDLVVAAGMGVMRGYLKLWNKPEAKKWARKVKKYSCILYGIKPGKFSWEPEVVAEIRDAGLNPAKL